MRVALFAEWLALDVARLAIHRDRLGKGAIGIEPHHASPAGASLTFELVQQSAASGHARRVWPHPRAAKVARFAGWAFHEATGHRPAAQASDQERASRWNQFVRDHR